MRAKTRLLLSLVLLVSACATPRGTGPLGGLIERAAGRLQVVETTTRTRLARIAGLGDLSHASLVYSRDARHAYVFGRDGGLTKIDLLRGRIDKRIVQAGNAIGGEFLVNTFTACSRSPNLDRASDGRFVVAWTEGNRKGAE